MQCLIFSSAWRNLSFRSIFSPGVRFPSSYFIPCIDWKCFLDYSHTFVQLTLQYLQPKAVDAELSTSPYGTNLGHLLYCTSANIKLIECSWHLQRVFSIVKCSLMAWASIKGLLWQGECKGGKGHYYLLECQIQRFWTKGGFYCFVFYRSSPKSQNLVIIYSPHVV